MIKTNTRANIRATEKFQHKYTNHISITYKINIYIYPAALERKAHENLIYLLKFYYNNLMNNKVGK